MSVPDLASRFHRVDTTAICDIDKTLRVMDSGIKLRSAECRLIGPAFTVRCRGDFLGVLRAIETATKGDVIVVDGGAQSIALGGELFARGALVRGLTGIIVDGGYRDMEYVSTCPLPVYSRSTTPLAGTTSKLGDLQVTISCGGVPVNPGDIVMADAEGIIVVKPDEVDQLLAAAVAVKEAEQRVIDKINSGQTLSAGLNVVEHVNALEQGSPSSLTFLY